MTDTSKKIETIEYRPTWESLVSSFVMLIENGDAKGRAWAIEEITRMAKAADIAVAEAKAKRVIEEDPEEEEDERTAYAEYAAEQRACGYEVVSFDEWTGQGKTARQKADERLSGMDPDDPDY